MRTLALSFLIGFPCSIYIAANGGTFADQAVLAVLTAVPFGILLFRNAK